MNEERIGLRQTEQIIFIWYSVKVNNSWWRR